VRGDGSGDTVRRDVGHVPSRVSPSSSPPHDDCPQFSNERATPNTEPRIQFRRCRRRRRTTSQSRERRTTSRRTRLRPTCDRNGRHGAAIVDLSPRESTSWQLIFHAVTSRCKPRPVLRTTCNIQYIPVGCGMRSHPRQLFDYHHPLHISVN